MTPEQYATLPHPQVLQWIKRKLEQQEQRDGKRAPAIYHDYIERVEKLLAEPIELAIETDSDWDKLDKLGF